MMAFKTLLLAHHGTSGAALAEQLAYQIAAPGALIVHLLVVPDFWAGMQGDDWLNNASTRDDFADHVEQLLEADAAEQVSALALRCAEHGLSYRNIVRFGDPAECLNQAALDAGAELVLIGPPRSKGAPGFRSRMDLDKLARGLTIPFLVASLPR